MSSNNEQDSSLNQREGEPAQQGNSSVVGAITFPTNNPNPAPAVPQPAQPRNLQDLLRYSVEAGNTGDGGGSHNMAPMDEEVSNIMIGYYSAKQHNLILCNFLFQVKKVFGRSIKIYDCRCNRRAFKKYKNSTKSKRTV